MADVQDHLFAAAVRWDLHVHIRVHARRRQARIATCPGREKRIAAHGRNCFGSIGRVQGEERETGRSERDMRKSDVYTDDAMILVYLQSERSSFTPPTVFTRNRQQ